MWTVRGQKDRKKDKHKKLTDSGSFQKRKQVKEKTEKEQRELNESHKENMAWVIGQADSMVCCGR